MLARDRPRPRRGPRASSCPTTSRASGCSKRAREEGRADDTPEVIDAPARDLPRARRSRSSSTTARRGKLVPLHARRARSTRSARRSSRRSTEAGRARDHPQVASARSSTMARAGTRRRRDARADRRAVEPGRDDGGARPHRGGVHPLAGRRARPSRATRAIPAAICASPNDMVVHGIPGAVRARGRRHALDRRRRHARRLRRRLRVDVPGRGDLRRRRRGCSRPARPRSTPGSSRRGSATRSATSRRPCRRSTEEAGFSVIRSLVGHGVGRSMHEEPQIPNFGRPDRGPELREGMTLAIEPMITAGAPDIYVHDDDWSISTDGRLALGAFRAHRRGHRDGRGS